MEYPEFCKLISSIFDNFDDDLQDSQYYVGYLRRRLWEALYGSESDREAIKEEIKDWS